MSTTRDEWLNLSATLASVAVAVTLVALKIWALGETASLSVAVALVDSGFDLIVSLGGLAAVVYAARPPDADHAFGHSSAEDLAALGQCAFIIASTMVIAGAAVMRLASGETGTIAAQGRGIVVMVVAIALTLCLVAWQRRVAARTGSRVVRADSLHYVGDVVPNVGAIVALWASAQFGLESVDSVVALGAAAFIAVGALRIGAEAWNALMDRSAAPEIIAEIEAHARNVPGVRGFHDLKTRTSGSRLFINLHIELDGGQTLNEAHAIGAALKWRILKDYPNADVIIHKDPVRERSVE